MKRLLLAFAVLAFFSAPAFAYTVQSGCTAAPATAPATEGSWYVNPTVAAGGTGTQAAPFQNIAAAVAASGGKGGTIYLMTGNYGDIAFNYGSAPITVGTNADWLRFVVPAGQTPVMTTLVVNHANKMIFDGIKVQSQDNAGDNVGYSLISVVDQGAAGPNQDLVFANMQLASIPSLTGLTQAQLASQLRTGMWIVSTGDTLGADVGTTGDDRGGMYTTCVSVSGNHVFNVRNGIILAANNSIVTNDEVDHYSNNGIAYAANDLTITHDNVHDVFNNGDNGATSLPGTSGTNGGATFIEGWAGPSHPGGLYNQFTGITIDSNKLTRQLDPALPFTSFPIYTASTPAGGPRGIVQGLNSADWWNITVTNNVVVTQGTCDGIHFPNIKGNSLIVNNTVVQESYIAGGGCPDVQIQAGEGSGSSVQVVGNIAPELWQWNTAVMNNNAATCVYDTNPTCSPIQLNGNRKNGGDITTKNNAGHSSFQVDTAQFANFCPYGACTTLSLSRVPDLHLSPLSWMVSSCDNYPATANSFACNATSFFARSVPGISPPLDIDGNPRFGDGVTVCTIPVPGAYSFPIPCSTVGSGPVPLPPTPPAPPQAPPVQAVSPPSPPSSPPPVTTAPPAPPSPTPPSPVGAAPANTAIPEIAGLDYPNNGVTAAATGTALTLTANNGQWSNAPTSFAYNWHAVGGPPLGTSQSLTLNTSTAGVLGEALEVDVTATNAGGSTTQTSHWFGPIEASAPVAPVAMEKSLPPTGPQPLPVEPAHFLQCYGPGMFQHAVFPGAAIPPCAPTANPAHVWYFDPVNGKTQAAGATGHAGSPFRDAPAIFNTVTGYSAPLFGSLIVPGDAIYLEPGNAASPIGDIASTSPHYSTSDGTTNGAVEFTWIMPDPAATSQPVLHSNRFQNGSAGFIVRGFGIEQYRENGNNPVTVAGGDNHDLLFEANSVTQWTGHSGDPWLPSHYPNTGGSSDGTVVTASPTYSYGVEDPTTTIATAPAHSTVISMSSAPSASLVGMYIWSPGYYSPSPVVIPGASGIPNGSKVVSISGNTLTIGPCDPVADHKSGCPSTPPPGCDPKTTSKNNTSTLSTFGGCPAGTPPAWNGTTRALNGEQVFYTAALTILPAGYWTHNDFEAAGASGFLISGALDRADSVDPTHPNLVIDAENISLKDNIVRDGFNGSAMLNVHNSIRYNNKEKWMSGDGSDTYTGNRVWDIHNYYSDNTVLWAHQDGIQYGDANGRGESAAATDALYGNAAVENEFYAQTDATNWFPRPIECINTTEHEHYFMYVADNIVSCTDSGGGIVIAGHYDVVVHNTVFGLATGVGHQRKGSDLTPIFSMLANNVGNGENRDNSIPNYCDPVLGDMDTVEGNVSLPAVPLAGASSFYCTTSHGAAVGANPGSYQGLNTWTQTTDWRSNQTGVSSLFDAYDPLGAATEPNPGWITPPFSPLLVSCTQNSFPSVGGCGPTVAGANNVRPNAAFSGTIGAVSVNVNFPQQLPSGLPDGTLGVVQTAVGTALAGVWKSCASCSLRTNGTTINWEFVQANYNPGIIGAGTNLGPQMPIANHDGNAWSNPPNVGAY